MRNVFRRYLELFTQIVQQYGSVEGNNNLFRVSVVEEPK